MTPIECFRLYVALKLHFTSARYDFKKYFGKVAVPLASFQSRRDRWFFESLANKYSKEKILGIFIANFAYRDGVLNFEAIQDKEYLDVYNEWCSNTQGLSYKFSQDIKKIGDIEAAIDVPAPWQHPELLKMVLRKHIALETVIVLDALTHCFYIWDARLTDRIVWPSLRFKWDKYAALLKFDKDKMAGILLSYAAENDIIIHGINVGAI